MRKKYFDWESVFARIWNAADSDGIWNGNAETLAREFGVPEDEAHDVLGELCGRGLIERLFQGKYAVVRWRERDDPCEELHWWEITPSLTG
ncbi:MAG TPA: hypothetical protein VE957_10250 [Terriglobales bacterium]|nr:hypothetical protein [Terriglobales bacterium]